MPKMKQMTQSHQLWYLLSAFSQLHQLTKVLAQVCLTSSSPDYEYDIGPRAQSCCRWKKYFNQEKYSKNIAATAGGPRGKDGACPEIGETVPGRGAAANALADFSLWSRQACSTTINWYLDLLLIVYLWNPTKINQILRWQCCLYSDLLLSNKFAMVYLFKSQCTWLVSHAMDKCRE